MTTQLMLNRDENGKAIVQVWVTENEVERVAWESFIADMMEAIRYARYVAEANNGTYIANIIDAIAI